MNSQFGNKIRILREEQKLLLRQLAPLLDMDTAQLSKIERGERNAKKETVLKLLEVMTSKFQQLTQTQTTKCSCCFNCPSENALFYTFLTKTA